MKCTWNTLVSSNSANIAGKQQIPPDQSIRFVPESSNRKDWLVAVQILIPFESVEDAAAAADHSPTLEIPLPPRAKKA